MAEITAVSMASMFVRVVKITPNRITFGPLSKGVEVIRRLLPSRSYAGTTNGRAA